MEQGLDGLGFVTLGLTGSAVDWDFESSKKGRSGHTCLKLWNLSLL